VSDCALVGASRFDAYFVGNALDIGTSSEVGRERRYDNKKYIDHDPHDDTFSPMLEYNFHDHQT